MFFAALERLLGPAHDSLVGDLQACYEELRETEGLGSAAAWLLWQLFTAVPRVLLLNVVWEKSMYKNYLVVAFRQMRRFWSFSLINVLGLALSMSVCLLIMSLLDDQGTVDSFHSNRDRIVRVTSRVHQDAGSWRMATSASALGPELVRQSPDVEGLLQMRRSGGQLIREDGLRATFSGIYAQPTFFDFFDFELQQGNADGALDDPFEVILSDEYATLLFGSSNPVGEVLQWGDVGDVTVSGVLAPVAGKTHVRSDVVISFATMESLAQLGHDIGLADWTNDSQFYNYLMLRDGASQASLEAVANTLSSQHHRTTEFAAPTYTVQAMSDINLGADLSNQIAEVMSREVALVLSVLAAILVLTAVFNYVNLTISRSIRRAREIGIRKVMGAQRGQLANQLVTEAVVTAIIALVFAVTILAWLLPQFNGLSEISNSSDIMRVSGVDWMLVLQFVAFAVGLGLLAGLLPAWRMSSMAPSATLKGLPPTGRRRLGLRKTLVVAQFAVSMVAIVLTVVLFRQAEFMNTADLGFDQHELVHIELQGIDYQTARTELLRVPGVSQVAATSAAPSGGSNTWTDIRIDDADEPLLMQTYAMDEHFLEQYRIRLLAGRNLSLTTEGESGGAILITESAARNLGFDSADQAVGETVVFDTYTVDSPVVIAGVVSDFYSNGVEDGLAPATLTIRPESYRYAAVRFEGERNTETVRRMEIAWQLLAPGAPMRYQFFDDQVREGFAAMSDAIRILGMFAFLIVAIASLGLLGMASYSAETRIREIGIRKVVGAGIGDVVTLLSREYLTLIAIALVIAAPIAYVVTQLYLSLFAEHVSIGPLTILAGVVPVVLLALLTVGSQTLRAATTNPVDVLRAE